MFRNALLASAVVLLAVAVFWTLPQLSPASADRFVLTGSGRGVFILDRETQSISFVPDHDLESEWTLRWKFNKVWLKYPPAQRSLDELRERLEVNDMILDYIRRQEEISR